MNFNVVDNRMTRQISSDRAYLERIVCEEFNDKVYELQEKYDCIFDVQTYEVKWLGTPGFYKKILKNKNKHARPIR